MVSSSGKLFLRHRPTKRPFENINDFNSPGRSLAQFNHSLGLERCCPRSRDRDRRSDPRGGQNALSPKQGKCSREGPDSPDSLLDSRMERAGLATGNEPIPPHADSFKQCATFVGGCALASTLNRRIVSWAATAPKSAKARHGKKARPGNPVGRGWSFSPDQTPFPSCESTVTVLSGPCGFVAPCRSRMATAEAYRRRKNSCIW
jgi:hypothetical protein